MFKSLLSFLIVTSCLNYSFADTGIQHHSENVVGTLSYQQFYKNPSYSKIVKANKEFITQINSSSDLGDKKHFLNMAGIFMAHIFKSHTDLLSQYAADFKTLSFYEKANFLNGLRIAEIDHTLLHQISDSRLNAILSSPVTLSELEKFSITDADHLDYLWSSYFATGHAVYIERILEVLQWDDEMLLLANECVEIIKLSNCPSGFEKELSDRQSQVQRKSEKLSKEKHDFSKRLPLMASAIWSLQINEAQDLALRQIIEDIFQQKTFLNYKVKIGVRHDT